MGQHDTPISFTNFNPLCKDHNVVFTPYLATEDADTMDVIFRGSDAEVEAFTKHWETDGQGLMAQNGLDAGIKLRPNLADLKEIGPNFDARWKSYFEGAPDKPVMWLGTFSTYAGNYPLPGVTALRKYFSAVYYVEYPVSTGHVHISNGLDPYGKLDFEPGYLNDATDIGILRWGYKKGREFARRMGVYRGEYVPGHPTFPDGSKATPQTYAKPVPVLTPDIDYSVEDDRAIDEYHRRADCSIAPSNVSANTYNTALAIGEKAALIISQDLGILGV
ncbi:hypothetical protein H0H93_010938 [Arthromyces matolae]|nr:hypothetical protein H0H93_010938 [Arthromyces matolae]